jgi:hypothetical protein
MINLDDEKLYCLINPEASTSIGAIGLKLLDRPDYLVGLFMFWNNVEDPVKFLEEMVKDFGEVRLFAPANFFHPSLVCKMCIDTPLYVVLDDKSKGFRRFLLDFLEMRASNPKPFISLRFNSERKAWDGKPIPYLSSIDSNFSLVPN